MSATYIEEWVARYSEDHPSFKAPGSSEHPLVLVLGGEMRSKLVNDLGGIVPFWWMVLAAVKEWFPEPGDSFEYKAFKTAFFGACGLAVDTDFEEGMNEAWEAFKDWENNKSS